MSDAAQSTPPDWGRLHTQTSPQEDELRDEAFLPIGRDICGIQIRQLTLHDLIVRFRINCPFFSNRTPTSGEIASFLWQLSNDPNTASPRTIRRGRIVRLLIRLGFIRRTKYEAFIRK